MTEMEEIKAVLADMNEKLNRVILQNKIAMNTAYGSPVKQNEEHDKGCINIIRYNAIKDFIYFVKCRQGGTYFPVSATFATSYKRLLKSLEEFKFDEAQRQDLYAMQQLEQGE